MEINSFSYKFIQDFESILKNDNFNSNIDFTLKKYNLKDQKFSTLLENKEFRCDLYETLKNLLIFYDEGEYYQEKYILLLLHLIFGVNPVEKKGISQNNIITNNKSTKNKNLIISKLDENYIEQNDKIEELISIIFNIIKKIQLQYIKNEENENIINDNENKDNIDDVDDIDIEYIFESDVKEFFFRHYSLFFHSLHKIINTLYSQMEINLNNSSDYVLFIKILCENKNNFRPLILSKLSRILNNYNNQEIELLSLFEEINLGDPYDLIKTNQRLKSLIYLNKQRGVNNNLILYENVKYINEHFLLAKYKISEKKFNNIYLKKEKNDENENIKNKMRKQIENIKNNIDRINYEYNNEINIIKNHIFQVQNKFNNNIKQLNTNLLNLNLELEKLGD